SVHGVGRAALEARLAAALRDDRRRPPGARPAPALPDRGRVERVRPAPGGHPPEPPLRRGAGGLGTGPPGGAWRWARPPPSGPPRTPRTARGCAAPASIRSPRSSPL